MDTTKCVYKKTQNGFMNGFYILEFDKLIIEGASLSTQLCINNIKCKVKDSKGTYLDFHEVLDL